MNERLLFDRLVGALPPELQQALKNPVRRSILRTLGRSDVPLTPRELIATDGGEGLSQVCFHLALLEQTGCVQRVEWGQRTFISAVAGDHEVAAVLKATADTDGDHE